VALALFYKGQAAIFCIVICFLDEGSARRVVGFALSGLLAGDGAGCICC